MTTSPAMNSSTVGRGKVAKLVLALALLAWFGFGATRWESKNPFDFYQFWMIGQGALEAKSAPQATIKNIYSEHDQRLLLDAFGARAQRSGSAIELAGIKTWSAIGMEPTATPLLYSTIALLSSGDFDRDARRFRLLSFALYVAGVAALALACGLPEWAALAAVIGFTQFFWPFFTDIGFGNVSQLQVGAVALLAILLRFDHRSGDLGAGALAGLLLLFKPTVTYAAALVALLWLIEGRARRLLFAAAGALAGIAMGLAVPSFVLGDACTWTQWREAFPRLMFTGRYLGGGLAGNLFGLESIPLFSLFGLLLFAVVAAVAARALFRRRAETGTRPARGPHAELVLLASGLALYLLSGPIVHSHYFLLAVPIALVALRPGQPLWRYPCALLATALVAAHPQLRALGLTAGKNHSLWSFLGVAILLGLSLASFWREHRSERIPR